ncbi:MAG: T9SS type A sorting domain-containing protein, partial [Bacteroidota bacterium]
FNGSWVKVSLHQHAGEAAAFKITTLKVTPAIENGSDQPSNARTITSEKGAKQENEPKAPLPSYAQAVGRFTNGVEARGTGWIAANGAVVTSYHYVAENYDAGSYNDDYSPEVYDIIEFNMPLSNPDGSINHSAPEDQYPINTDYVFARVIGGKVKNDFGPDFFKMRQLHTNVYGKNYHAGYSIVEVLPNGTGKRPGERIQEYFQVTRHPSGPTMEGQALDVIHSTKARYLDPTEYYTVQLRTLLAKDPAKLLRSVSDKDRFLVYVHFESLEKIGADEPAIGAPITYENSNVAVGIHNRGATVLGLGTGFRDDEFRRHLGEFFSDKTTYVDPNSYWNEENGTIDKPYLTIANAAQNVDEDGVLSIVKGSYNEGVTLNTPMTVKVPLGPVVIGASGGSNTRNMRPSLPADLFVDDETHVLEEGLEADLPTANLRSFPNPFTQHTELHYTLTDDSPVQVKVYDMLGLEVQTLVEEEQLEGKHSVQWDGRNQQGKTMPTGLYIMQLHTGGETSAIRVMKQ